MDYIKIPNNFQLNKLMFFNQSDYSENTKKLYWNLYLLYIADIEEVNDIDLYDFSQDKINVYKKSVNDKSKQTILQTNAFINKYTQWYAKFYDKPEKKFDLIVKKEIDNSWYISKEYFFKLCNEMLKNTTISTIIPLIFARCGIMGKELLYMRNLKWHDIDFENNEILIRNENRKIISYTPVDNDFFKWITMLKEYEKEKYKNEEIKNRYIIKSQIYNDEIVNYNAVNSKVYTAFNSNKIKRISFTTLFNCAIVDHLKHIYNNEKLSNWNDELIKQLDIFYHDENLDSLKIANIKRMYTNLIDININVQEFEKNENMYNIQENITLIPKLKSTKGKKNTNCSIDGCDKLIYAKKMCESHYRRKRKLQQQIEHESGNSNLKICKVEGCNEIARTKGYCNRHHVQILTHGEIISVGKLRQKHSDICSIEGCNDKPYALGYCPKHYKKHLRYGDPLYEKPSKCTVEGCEKAYFSKGYCQKHYLEFIKNRQ